MVVFENVQKEDIKKLSSKGFCSLEPKTVYEEFRCSHEGVTLILYTSGKLVLQGQQEQVEKVAEKLRKLNLGSEIKPIIFRKETGWIIGSDEALKGDTFGGLVVAAVKADDAIREKLRELGVADSKNLSDVIILPLAEKIKQIAPCEVKSLLPEEYNRECTKEGDITKLLNILHTECARFLFPGKHMVDKYPGCAVGDVAEEKAESKYVEVAAASVLARAAALKQLDYLSLQAGFTLPKGSTHVKLALHELQERKLEFRKFVKVHFANVKEFL